MSEGVAVTREQIQSIAGMAGTDRERVPGRYSMTDLLKRTLRQLYDWHTGVSEQPPLDKDWWRYRGYGFEAALMAKHGLSMDGHGLLLRWQPAPESHPTCLLTGHPDHVDLVTGMVREMKSARDCRDEDIIENATTQGQGYGGALRRGAELVRENPHGGPVVPVPLQSLPEQVQVLVADLDDDYAAPSVPVDTDSVEALLDNIARRAMLLDDVLFERKPVSALDEFDALETPPMVDPEVYVAPIAEGEQGEQADDHVFAYEQYSYWKGEHERLKAQWKETLKQKWEAVSGKKEKKKAKTMLAPSGGSVTLIVGTTQKLDEEAFTKAKAPAVEKKLEQVIQKIEEDVAPLRAQLERAQREHPKRRALEALQEYVARARTDAMMEVQYAKGVRTNLPKKKQAQGADS